MVTTSKLGESSSLLYSLRFHVHKKIKRKNKEKRNFKHAKIIFPALKIFIKDELMLMPELLGSLQSSNRSFGQKLVPRCCSHQTDI